jgi:bifunctional UDP-N-acetylglucosamine pyrophosphorylase/glucosamine-1-phosphate N-acetyltransferase
VQQAASVLSGFDGNILILYGDTPFVAAETLTEMLGRLDGPDGPAIGCSTL